MKKILVTLLAILLLTVLAACGNTQTTTTPHVHNYAEAVTAPTCVEKGYTTYTCTCGDSYTGNDTAALGHHYVNRVCQSCGDKTAYSMGLAFALDEANNTYYVLGLGSCQDTDVAIPAEHNGLPVTGIDAYAFYGTNITEITIPGSVVFIGDSAFGGCTQLVKIYYEGSLANWLSLFEKVNTGLNKDKYTFHCKGGSGHDHIYTLDLTPATCTEDGFADYTCECGDHFTLVIPAGHSYGKEITKTPTCTEEGIAVYTCAGCGDSYSGKLNLLAHTHTETVTEPTCTEQGYSTFTCTGCGDSYVDEYVNALGHNYKRYVCQLCGHEIIPSAGLEFTKNDDGRSYCVSGIGDCQDTEIVIPLEHMGLPVTGIADYAFEECSSLTSVTIPESVNSIGNDAFYFCSSLTSVTISEGVTSIGGRAFYGCNSLVSINIPDSVIQIDGYAFNGCWRVAQNEYSLSYVDKWVVACDKYTVGSALTLRSDTEGIAGNIFSDCQNITSIVIPDSVRSIGSYAFHLCTGLTDITIPAGVTNIADTAFSSCTNLQSIEVASGNSVYHSAGNCIIETASKTLVLGCDNSSIPADGSVTAIGNYAFKSSFGLTSIAVPNGITSIGDYAFSNCGNLVSITIPNGVTTIGDYAFDMCGSLTDITIPNSVTSIGDSAFSDCRSLISISIPDSITSIGAGAFSYCHNLTYNEYDNACYLGSADNPYLVLVKAKSTDITSCNIHPDTKFIGEEAFYNCSGLTSVTIPDNILQVGTSAFHWCTSLSYNEYDNAYYLGNANNPYLVLVKASSFDITGCTIHSDTRIIYCGAFEQCVNMTGITIPHSVISIGVEAFEICTKLTSIHFTGKVEEWMAIAKGHWWNPPMNNYTIYCTDGEITN